MNEQQKIEFDLLKEFVRVCEKLGLKYYLVCGSALGAVKYSGFIPWDDDLDVGLLRNDYEVFLREAPKMLPKNLFLQNYRTDKYYPLLMSKLRNSDTCYIEKLYSTVDMNHGIYIDIFPLDGYPKNKSEQQLVEHEKVLYTRRRMVRWNYNWFSANNVRHPKLIGTYLMHLLFGCYNNTQAVIERIDNVVSQYPCDDSEIWCNHGNWQGQLEYAAREQYGNGTEAFFEGIKVRIPEKYDEYFTQKYGKWQDDLPDEEKKSPHEYSVLDTKMSYTHYVQKKRNGKIKIIPEK